MSSKYQEMQQIFKLRENFLPIHFNFTQGNITQLLHFMLCFQMYDI